LIVLKAFCVFSRNREILVYEKVDKKTGQAFLRPIGGKIEFGERSSEAIQREVYEETGQKIKELKLLGVLENIFTQAGDLHHEVDFVYDAKFANEDIYNLERIEVREGENLYFASWKSVNELQKSDPPFVPPDILKLLNQ